MELLQIVNLNPYFNRLYVSGDIFIFVREVLLYNVLQTIILTAVVLELHTLFPYIVYKLVTRSDVRMFEPY